MTTLELIDAAKKEVAKADKVFRTEYNRLYEEIEKALEPLSEQRRMKEATVTSLKERYVKEVAKCKVGDIILRAGHPYKVVQIGLRESYEKNKLPFHIEYNCCRLLKSGKVSTRWKTIYDLESVTIAPSSESLLRRTAMSHKVGDIVRGQESGSIYLLTKQQNEYDFEALILLIGPNATNGRKAGDKVDSICLIEPVPLTPDIECALLCAKLEGWF